MPWECPRCYKMHSDLDMECNCHPLTLTTTGTAITVLENATTSEDEIATLRARVAELESDLADPFTYRPITPAEREVIEKAIHWMHGDTALCVDDLVEAVAALEKERSNG